MFSVYLYLYIFYITSFYITLTASGQKLQKL